MPNGRRRGCARATSATAATTMMTISTATAPAARRLALLHALVVQRAIEQADQAAHPGHRMADGAHQPIRITDRGLDQERQKGERDGHDVPRGCSAACAWRRSRRRAAAVSGRAGTFRRPVDRDQSPCLSDSATGAGRVPAPAGAGGDRRLSAVAAQAYGAPSAAHVVAAPGTQILLPLVAALVPPGRAAVLGPTYSEHVRVARARAGTRA